MAVIVLVQSLSRQQAKSERNACRYARDLDVHMTRHTRLLNLYGKGSVNVSELASAEIGAQAAKQTVAACAQEHARCLSDIDSQGEPRATAQVRILLSK